MNIIILPVFACLVLAVSAWSTPYYPVRQYRAAPYKPVPYRTAPYRVVAAPHYTRHAYQPPAVHEASQEEEEDDDSNQQRAKREPLEDDYGKDFYQEPSPSHETEDKGVTGPVHTFVKTDKNANYKWGVRHHVGNKYAS